MKQRNEISQGSDEYKILTKKIKKRVNQLKNEKFAKEVEKINEYANKKQIEDLYRSFKSDNSSFSKYKSKTGGCDQNALKTYFKRHFTAETVDTLPLELTDAPAFLSKLQAISTDVKGEHSRQIITTTHTIYIIRGTSTYTGNT